MTKYNRDALLQEAAGLAPQHASIRGIARAMEIPFSTLQSAMALRRITLDDLKAGVIEPMTPQAAVEKLRLQQKMAKRELEIARGELGRREWWRDTLEEVAAVLSPDFVEGPPLVPKPEKPQTAVLLLSDVHLGQITPSEQVGLFGEYDSEIAMARVRHTFTTFASIASHQPFAIEEAIVMCLGDLVEHAHLRPGHEAFVDLNAVKQTLAITNCCIAGIIMLAATFPKVRVLGVPGNHGRVTADYRRSDPTENFDYLSYRITQMALEHQSNVVFDIPESWYVNFKIYQHIFFAMHGENIRSYVGFPWYGATRAARQYVAMFRLAEKRRIRDRDPQTREEFEDCLIVPDYALLGHFHTTTTWEAPDIEHFANGSMPGVSHYGAKKVMKINKPSQRLFFVYPKYGVTLRCPIDLDEVA